MFFLTNWFLLSFICCGDEPIQKIQQKWNELTETSAVVATNTDESSPEKRKNVSTDETPNSDVLTVDKANSNPSKKSHKKTRKNTKGANAQFQEEQKYKNRKNTKPFDPLLGKSLYEICKSRGLSLIKWSYDERRAKKECCSNKLTSEQKEDIFCDMDWPFGDVPRCSGYDAMRNEIYAQYGKVFSSERLQIYFETKSWYEPKEGFGYHWLSQTAKANIAILRERKNKEVECLSE